VTSVIAPTVPTPARHVPTRRVSFDYPLGDLPKHFAADGDLVSSHVIPVLSSMFPDGEDFFVRSVRQYRDRIEDPELKKQVSGFIGQEAIHGREHREVNERFQELGYPTKRMERITDKSLRFRERVAPGRANLAATAALEHYTATLAELLLSDPEARAMIGHEEVRALFLWHALEESEHKAVAFDVYKAVGGSERLRTWTMNFISIGFVATIVIATAISMLCDPVVRRSPLRTLRSLRRFARSPFASKELYRRIREYNRPDFHPDDRDTTALVEQWRDELFGEAGALRDRLPSRS
jgi:predicted metal-dependent hydrolase